MLNMTPCIIFDMDGVIIDSEPIHKECERRIFDRFGIAVSKEEHSALVGITTEALWSHIDSKYKLPVPVSEAIALKKLQYLECLKADICIKPIAFVSELIEELYNNSFVLALASSSPMEQVNYVLNRFRLKEYFNCIVSGDHVREGKPNPEIFLKAAQFVKIDPELCVVIEDSFNGVSAAKAAGMKCIGYRNPNSEGQDLSRADVVVSSFEELTLDLIKALV